MNRQEYIKEKIILGIYESNILSAVEKFIDLDKGDRETLLHDIGIELEELKQFILQDENLNL